MYSEQTRHYLNSIAPQRDQWRQRNRYYHHEVEKLYQFLIPPGSSVLQVGSETGDLLQALQCRRGVGIEDCEVMVKIAKQKYPHLEFHQGSIETCAIEGLFDYIILADSVGLMEDVQNSLQQLHPFTTPRTRIILSYFNYLWEPLLKLAETLRLKIPQPQLSWLAPADLEDLLYLSDYEVIRKGQRVLFPKYIPLFSIVLNKYLSYFPLIDHLCLIQYIIARPKPDTPLTNAKRESLPSCTVVIPCRNEKGNIEAAVRRLPELGCHTEVLFVEGGSTDGTREEIERVISLYGKTRDIKLIVQQGKGKADAVRSGFRHATGELLLILDADLTVSPEDLPKFFEAAVRRKGEFIMGSRLVYPMENEAMPLLNVMGNKIFSTLFSWILDQHTKDTLCGTKVLFKSDYEAIERGRAYFGEFDPFGDFDLIFGAAKQNLKIVEIPIRYRERTYGTTNISRWRHGWLLFRMCGFAMRRMKFL